MSITTRIEAFRVLGLPVNATQEDIKNAYKKMSKQYHPDVVGEEGTAHFYQVNEAYNFLMSTPAVQTKVYGMNESAVRYMSNQKVNREKARRQKAKEDKRKKERKEALEREAKAMRQRRLREQEIKRQAEEEADKQVRAMEMAYIISKMLGDK